MWPREENGDEIENVWLHIFIYYLWRAERSPWWRDVDEDVDITVEFSHRLSRWEISRQDMARYRGLGSQVLYFMRLSLHQET